MNVYHRWIFSNMSQYAGCLIAHEVNIDRPTRIICTFNIFRWVHLLMCQASQGKCIAIKWCYLVRIHMYRFHSIWQHLTLCCQNKCLRHIWLVWDLRIDQTLGVTTIQYDQLEYDGTFQLLIFWRSTSGIIMINISFQESSTKITGRVSWENGAIK